MQGIAGVEIEIQREPRNQLYLRSFDPLSFCVSQKNFQIFYLASIEAYGSPNLEITKPSLTSESSKSSSLARSTVLNDIVPGCSSTTPHPAGKRRDAKDSLGQVPRLTVIANGFRLRSIWNLMKSPGCFLDTRHMKSSSPWIGPPSSSKITSLASIPALAAEVSFLTSATNTPRSGRPRAWPSASVKSDTTTPTRATAWARNDVCHDIATMVTNNNSTTCLVRFMRPDPLCIASPIHVTGIHQLIFVVAPPPEPRQEQF